MDIDYTYALDFYRTDGTALGQRPLDPDWTPALEWVHFEGIREGRLPAVMAVNRAHGAGRVEPVWHPQSGQPYVSGFRVVLSANGADAVSRQIPTAYLRGTAQRAAAAFVEQGLLQTGEAFQYLVSAFVGRHPHALDVAAGGFAVEEIAQPLPLTAASLETYVAGAVPAGGDHVAGDFSVFVRQAVVDEAAALSRQAGDVETGGVLVGLLHHDPSVPE